ncbi:hypothetical protein DFH09DRAFT_1090077 [Mycena vulgaris]|nr:hypothetical protein DFH09DRAFT_1090077 [Mycena vulgaris]
MWTSLVLQNPSERIPFTDHVPFAFSIRKNFIKEHLDKSKEHPLHIYFNLPVSSIDQGNGIYPSLAAAGEKQKSLGGALLRRESPMRGTRAPIRARGILYKPPGQTHPFGGEEIEGLRGDSPPRMGEIYMHRGSSSYPSRRFVNFSPPYSFRHSFHCPTQRKFRGLTHLDVNGDASPRWPGVFEKCVNPRTLVWRSTLQSSSHPFTVELLKLLSITIGNVQYLPAVHAPALYRLEITDDSRQFTGMELTALTGTTGNNHTNGELILSENPISNDEAIGVVNRCRSLVSIKMSNVEIRTSLYKTLTERVTEGMLMQPPIRLEQVEFMKHRPHDFHRVAARERFDSLARLGDVVDKTIHFYRDVRRLKCQNWPHPFKCSLTSVDTEVWTHRNRMGSNLLAITNMEGRNGDPTRDTFTLIVVITDHCVTGRLVRNGIKHGTRIFWPSEFQGGWDPVTQRMFC